MIEEIVMGKVFVREPGIFASTTCNFAATLAIISHP
jgi:hypothetical protein